MFHGLRSVIYPAPDLPASRAWFASLLGTEPYFDEPFYVGFSVGGYELGLDPNAAAVMLTALALSLPAESVGPANSGVSSTGVAGFPVSLRLAIGRTS